MKIDIREINRKVDNIRDRVSDVEQEIKSAKTVVKACAAIAAVVFVCTYIFGSSINKIMDAINSLVIHN